MSGSAARGITVATTLAGILTYLNMYATQAILPSLTAEFGVPLARTSLTITMPLLAVALLAPFVGAISDRLGRKRLIVGAAFALTLPTLLCAAAGSFEWLLVWRFAQGVLLPFVFAVTVAYIGDECEGAAMIRTTGTYAAGGIFGGFAGRFLSGVVTDLAGWRMSFVVLAAITVLCAAAIAMLMPRERRFTPSKGGIRSALGAYGEHLSNPRLLATCVVGFGMLFSNVALFTYVNFMLVQPPFGLSPGQLGLVFGVYLLGLVTTTIASRVAVRIGRRATVAAALCLSCVGLGLTLLAYLPAVIMGLACVTAGLMTSQAMSLSYIGVAVRRARSAAVGVYVTIFYIGGSLGGVLPGLLWPRYGWPGVVGIIFAALLAMFAASLFWRDPRAAA